MDIEADFDATAQTLRTLSIIWNAMGLIMMFGAIMGVHKMRAIKDRRAGKHAIIMQLGLLLMFAFDATILTIEKL